MEQLTGPVYLFARAVGRSEATAATPLSLVLHFIGRHAWLCFLPQPRGRTVGSLWTRQFSPTHAATPLVLF